MAGSLQSEIEAANILRASRETNVAFLLLFNLRRVVTPYEVEAPDLGLTPQTGGWVCCDGKVTWKDGDHPKSCAQVIRRRQVDVGPTGVGHCGGGLVRSTEVEPPEVRLLPASRIGRKSNARVVKFGLVRTENGKALSVKLASEFRYSPPNFSVQRPTVLVRSGTNTQFVWSSIFQRKATLDSALQ